MSDGTAALNAMIAKLRGMRALTAEIAREAAPAVQAVVRQTAAAGTTVEGQPWAATKLGRRALPNAAAHVKAMAVGAAIVIAVDGPYVFHNSMDGKSRRRILPETSRGVPSNIAKAIVSVAESVWARHTRAA